MIVILCWAVGERHHDNGIDREERNNYMGNWLSTTVHTQKTNQTASIVSLAPSSCWFFYPAFTITHFSRGPSFTAEKQEMNGPQSGAKAPRGHSNLSPEMDFLNLKQAAARLLINSLGTNDSWCGPNERCRAGARGPLLLCESTRYFITGPTSWHH